MTQHNQAPRQPRGLLACSKWSLSWSHWQAGTSQRWLFCQRQVGQTTDTWAVWDCITPQCSEPATAPPRERELMGEQWWAWVLLHGAAAQVWLCAHSKAPSAHSRKDNLLTRWSRAAGVFLTLHSLEGCRCCLWRNTLLWYLGYKHTDARMRNTILKKKEKPN